VFDSGSATEAVRSRNIRGLRSSWPAIADAFERHQPYQYGHEALAHLPLLYGVNQHQDFTRQAKHDGTTFGLIVNGMAFMNVGSHGMRIGGPPPWNGVPINPMFVEGGGVAAYHTQTIDWYFRNPPVSVAGTLVSIQDICVDGCEAISREAGL